MLRVTVQGGRGYLHFECRIGHAFSTDELIAAKERQFEDGVWAAVTTVRELVQLLRDLEEHGVRPARDSSFAHRIARGEAQATALRSILEDAGAIDLNPSSDPPELTTLEHGDASE